MATTITMRTILITGAANGLGAAFLKTYQKQPDTTILAVDRLPIEIAEPNVRTFKADLAEEQSILGLSSQLASQPIDLLVSNINGEHGCMLVCRFRATAASSAPKALQSS